MVGSARNAAQYSTSQGLPTLLSFNKKSTTRCNPQYRLLGDWKGVVQEVDHAE